MNRGDQPAAAWPERAAIAMLGLPAALFFGAWFQPLIGVPAAAIAIWSSWKLMRSVSSAPLPSRGALLFLALVALLWTLTAGLGGVFHQMWDHNFRNALLHDLIDRSWPVLWETPQGAVALDYYLAWSLIPALAGKVLGWRVATLAMAAICAGGVFLVMLLFVRIVGIWRWWIPFLLLLWSGMDILGWGLRGRLPDSATFIESWAYPLWYLSHQINFYCIAHLVIPSWLATLLVVGGRIPPSGLVATSAFLIPLAPFQAIGIAPFVAWKLLLGEGALSDRIRKSLTPENIVAPLVYAALCAPYFLGNQGAGKDSGWLLSFPPPPSAATWVKYAAFWLLEILLPTAAVWMAGQRDRVLVLAVVVLSAIPTWRAGISNDFALKVSVPGLLILTIYTAKAFVSNPNGWRKWFLIGVFAIGSATPLHELWVATYYTIANRRSLEQDNVKTFDPAHPCPGAHERPYLVNFRSHPLAELPLLRRMLARVPNSPTQSRNPRTVD